MIKDWTVCVKISKCLCLTLMTFNKYSLEITMKIKIQNLDGRGADFK